MPVLTLTRGLPGCGKSTWAENEIRNKKAETIIVCRDNIREMMAGSHQNYRFRGTSEDMITEIQLTMISEAYKKGWNVIVADTNLSSLCDKISIHAKVLGFDVRIKDFYKDFIAENGLSDDYFGMRKFSLKCKQQDVMRSKVAGEEIIDGMLEKYYYSTLSIPFNDPALEQAVIFDIDGTLANHDGIRSPFDESKVLLDLPHPEVIEMVKAEREFHKRKIIIMSGRKSSSRTDTMKWLEDNGVQYDYLYMRDAKDSRSDDIVKYELYMEHVNGKYYVNKIYDDRQKVCDMWRTALSLRVFQVAPGNF